MSTRDVRADLADYAHDAWSGWMTYLFAVSERRADGAVVIPADQAARWLRQMTTPYADLPPAEQASDLVEAERMLAIMREAGLYTRH